MTSHIVIPYDRHQYFHDKMQQYKDAQDAKKDELPPVAVSLDRDDPSSSITECCDDDKNPGSNKQKRKTVASVCRVKSLDDRFDESVKIFYELERNGYLILDDDREFVENEFRKYVVDGESTTFRPPAKKSWTVCLYNTAGERSGIHAR